MCTISVVPTTLTWPSVARFFAICAWMRSSSSTVKLLPRLSVDWRRRPPSRLPPSSSSSSSLSSSSMCPTWARSEFSRKTDVSGLGCGRRPFVSWRMTSWKVLVGRERARDVETERWRDLLCCSGETALEELCAASCSCCFCSWNWRGEGKGMLSGKGPRHTKLIVSTGILRLWDKDGE